MKKNEKIFASHYVCAIIKITLVRNLLRKEINQWQLKEKKQRKKQQRKERQRRESNSTQRVTLTFLPKSPSDIPGGFWFYGAAPSCLTEPLLPHAATSKLFKFFFTYSKKC